ncbi:MAG: hypothetical protein IJN27_01660 [Oscillospiraceae bacterium]|nr:hypothetical protein [Oscillospiraceae bacterium]
MQKTWKEIRNEVVNLGFEKEKTYDKYMASFLSAFNWALTYIATSISPIYAETEFTAYDTAEEFTGDGREVLVGRVALNDICPEFYRFIEVTSEDGTANVLVENGNLWTTKNGKYTVKYYKYPKVCGGADDYVCEIDYAYANIIAYLVAHRVWMDDDMSKSVLYWNTFEDLKNQIATTNPGITVSGGWI